MAAAATVKKASCARRVGRKSRRRLPPFPRHVKLWFNIASSVPLNDIGAAFARTSTNDSAAQIAAMYAGAADGIHVFVAYDDSNVGAVYAVQHGSDGAFAATLVGSIDLQQTGWATLGASNFM